MFNHTCFVSLKGLRRCYIGWLVFFGCAHLASAQAAFDRHVFAKPQAAPALSGHTVDGNAWRAGDAKGKVLMLSFWASWCGICKHELPRIQTLNDLLDNQHLTVMTVNWKESAPVVQRYVKNTGMQLPVLLDEAGISAKAWGVKSVPTTFLIDAKGRLREKITGEVDWTSPQAIAWVEAIKAKP